MRILSLLSLLCCGLAVAAQPRLVDAHVHHNGDPAFLQKLVAKLDAASGVAFLLTAPKDLDSVKAFMTAHPNRLIGFGSIQLDDPNVLELIDRFHAAGFRGLGELTGPLKNYDDPSYWPIFERAEKYRIIVLFHTGIVNRRNPGVSSDVSVDRMRPTTLDLIARKFPKLTLIGAHLGNPDYAWAAEISRWNPNLYFDLSGSTLIKKQEDYKFFKTLFWWSGIVSPHTPVGGPSAFEKIVYGSDVFDGDLAEFDGALERYHRLLTGCGAAPSPPANIFARALVECLNPL